MTHTEKIELVHRNGYVFYLDPLSNSTTSESEFVIHSSTLKRLNSVFMSRQTIFSHCQSLDEVVANIQAAEAKRHSVTISSFTLNADVLGEMGWKRYEDDIYTMTCDDTTYYLKLDGGNRLRISNGNDIIYSGTCSAEVLLELIMKLLNIGK